MRHHRRLEAARAVADLAIVTTPSAIDVGGCSGEKSGTGGNGAPLYSPPLCAAPAALLLLPTAEDNAPATFDCLLGNGPEPPLLNSGDELSLLLTPAPPLLPAREGSGDVSRSACRSALRAAFASFAARLAAAACSKSPIVTLLLDPPRPARGSPTDAAASQPTGALPRARLPLCCCGCGCGSCCCCCGAYSGYICKETRYTRRWREPHRNTR